MVIILEYLKISQLVLLRFSLRVLKLLDNPISVYVFTDAGMRNTTWGWRAIALIVAAVIVKLDMKDKLVKCMKLQYCR